jgi:exopolyphosphatase/pppGpp-phosphohydrolase
LQQGYEEAMEKARQRQGIAYPESAQSVNEVFESANSNLAPPLSVNEDNKSNIKALFASVGLSIQHQQRLARMFYMIQNLGPLTPERPEAGDDLEKGNKGPSANDVVLNATVIDQTQIDRQS